MIFQTHILNMNMNSTVNIQQLLKIHTQYVIITMIVKYVGYIHKIKFCIGILSSS